MATITIQRLYEEIKNEFLTVSNLKALYVGKTNDKESAKKRHDEEYDNYKIIAIGDSTVISKAEDFFIKKLKQDFPSFIDNKNGGSAGDPNADLLYITWNVDYKNEHQLDEPDLLDEPYMLVGE